LQEVRLFFVEAAVVGKKTVFTLSAFAEQAFRLYEDASARLPKDWMVNGEHDAKVGPRVPGLDVP
jgi:hypothetical protein